MLQRLALACITALAVGCQSSGPATSPTTRPSLAWATLDGDVWTRRNLDVLREMVDLVDEADADATFAFTMSLSVNPVLLRDPYTAEVLRMARAYQGKAGEEDELERALDALDRPEAERWALTREKLSGRPLDVRDQMKLVARAYYDGRSERAEDLVAEVVGPLREAGEWRELADGYVDLVGFARDIERPDVAAMYVDQVAALVKAHPELLETFLPTARSRGRSFAGSYVRVMREDGRENELIDLARQAAPEARRAVAAELAEARVGDGDFEGANAVVDDLLRGDDPDAADALTAALSGDYGRLPGTRFEPVRSQIVNGLAARGEVAAAGRLQIAVRGDRFRTAGHLPDYQWARLAMTALDHGYEAAAREGFARAIQAVDDDSLRDEAERRELQALAREAVELGAFEVAEDVLSSSNPQGTSVRVKLAQAYRKAGQPEAALTHLDAGLAYAYGPGNDQGAAMAQAAAELEALGKTDRAAEVFLDSLPRIEGVDFGISGTQAVIDAAIEMNRPELLDQAYQRGDFGERLLLSMFAARRAFNDAESRERLPWRRPANAT